MKLNRTWTMVVAIVMALTLSLSGTLAYLQDSDSDVNVMTLGNVDILQNEQQLAEDGVTLEEFQQNKDLYPGTSISKIVTVTNKGRSDAYFRTLIAFEDIESDTFEIGFPISEGNWRWSWGAPEATIVVDGVTYQVYEALYTAVLKPGETSPASLTKVELSKTATNEDMEALGYDYEILVLTQAVQTAGFDSAQAALDEAFGDVDNTTAALWFGAEFPEAGSPGDEWPNNNPPTLVSDQAALEAALENGGSASLANSLTTTENIVMKGGLLNGNGNTITKSYDGTESANAGVYTTGGTITNLTVEAGTNSTNKGLRAIYVTAPQSDLYVDNCVLNGTYAFNVNSSSAQNMNLKFNNTVLNGWVSYSPVKSAEFTDCKFTAQTLRPYANTTLKNCSFAEGVTITRDIKDANTFTITLIDCTANGTAVTASNFEELLAGESGSYSLQTSQNITVVVNDEKVDLAN